MNPGQRVENTVSNRLGTVASQPYVADNATYLVADVRWDNGNRSTVQASKLRPLTVAAIVDRNGTPITVGAIVTVYPKSPGSQSLAGKVGKATALLNSTAARPVCVIIPGECGLFQFTTDEVEVDPNPTIEVTYSHYWPRDSK